MHVLLMIVSKMLHPKDPMHRFLARSRVAYANTLTHQLDPVRQSYWLIIRQLQSGRNPEFRFPSELLRWSPLGPAPQLLCELGDH